MRLIAIEVLSPEPVMTAFALSLILAAAVVHASWNYLLKRSGGGVVFVWLFAALSALIYAPATYASTEELIELCKVASQYGGMYIVHMRSEGNRFLEAFYARASHPSRR